MRQELKLKEGILLKDPAEERRLLKELIDRVEKAVSRMFIPTVAFDEEKIKKDLVRAKMILNKMV